MNQVNHKSTATVLLQKEQFKAASDNASNLKDDSLIKQMRTAYWLSQEEMPPLKFTSLPDFKGHRGRK